MLLMCLLEGKLSDKLSFFLYLFQIDIFEQQFRSISKIDFMERYISEVKTLFRSFDVNKKKHFLYNNLADLGNCCTCLRSFSSCKSEHV